MRAKTAGTASLPINIKELKRKYMMGYCWILLCKDEGYLYKKDKWIDICKRTQEIRDKLANNGVTLDEIGDMMNRCRDFMNKPLQVMDLDQKVFFAELLFIWQNW